jgi:hypothetical protein
VRDVYKSGSDNNGYPFNCATQGVVGGGGGVLEEGCISHATKGYYCRGVFFWPIKFISIIQLPTYLNYGVFKVHIITYKL